MFRGEVLSWELDKESLSARDVNRHPRRRLRCWQERVEAGRGFWWGAGGQAQVAQNLADHWGIFNGGEDGQGAAARRAGGEVDGKDAFE